MDLWILLGAVGSVASIVGLVASSQGIREKLVHVVYALAIAGFASIAVWNWSENNRVKDVERAASVLLKEWRSYSTEGSIQAALTFLEKNSDLYPDSYARAQELCRLNECLSPRYGVTGRDSLDHAYNRIDVASALKGLIRGVGALESDS